MPLHFASLGVDVRLAINIDSNGFRGHLSQFRSFANAFIATLIITLCGETPPFEQCPHILKRGFQY